MRACLSCAVCALLALLLAITGLRYLTDFWLLSFVYSFQLHIGLLGMVAALACLAVRRTLFASVLFLSAAFLAGHAVVMEREFVPGRPAALDGTTPLRVLSFNILGDNHVSARQIAETIRASGADVAFIMEAEPLRAQLEALADAYPHRVGCGEQTPTCDLLILSRHPITKKVVASLSELRSHRFALADIEIGGQTVHFVGVHLTKPYFDDYHTTELQMLARILRGYRGPRVLAGDFNSSSIAPDMQHFLRSMRLTAAGSEPATWPIEAGRFGIAIDHIYVSEGIVPVSLERLPDSLGSNHYGLVADLAVGGQP